MHRMFVFPHVYVETNSPVWENLEVSFRSLDDEDGALRNGIQAPSRKCQSASWLALFSPCRGQRGVSSPQTRKRALSTTQPCWHSDLRLPASNIVRINFCCVSVAKFMVLCYSNPNRLRHCPYSRHKQLHP